MQAWHQIYTPLGSLGLSAFVAAIPIIFFSSRWPRCGSGPRRRGDHAAALARRRDPRVRDARTAGARGGRLRLRVRHLADRGIIVAAVFLYKIVVKTGQFDIIRASVLSITDDQRLQMLLIGFSFGAFLEGAAGFGAPVAITAALLVGLGFAAARGRICA